MSCLYDKITETETQRLHLRPFKGSDAEAVLAYKASDTLNIHRMAKITTIEDSIVFTQQRADYLLEKRGIAWAIEIRGSGRLIGNIEFLFPKDNARYHMLEIGYYIGQRDRGLGYAAEAIQEVVAGAFWANNSLLRIHAEVLPSNLDSIRCLEKCGFYNDGILRAWDTGELDEIMVPIDIQVMSLLRNDFLLQFS